MGITPQLQEENMQYIAMLVIAVLWICAFAFGFNEGIEAGKAYFNQ